MTNHSALADKVLTSAVVAPVSLTATPVNGTVIDMSGWDGVQFVIPIGVIGAGGTLDAKVQSANNLAMTGAADIPGAAIVQVPTAGGSNVVIIDVYRPTLRYLRLVMTGHAAGALAGAVAQRYRRAGILPPTQAATQVIRVIQN